MKLDMRYFINQGALFALYNYPLIIVGDWREVFGPQEGGEKL